MFAEDHREAIATYREFADAIKNKVFYVKFTINARGLPDWAIQIDKDFKNMDTLCLRSKYGYGKASDKMGVQP